MRLCKCEFQYQGCNCEILDISYMMRTIAAHVSVPLNMILTLSALRVFIAEQIAQIGQPLLWAKQLGQSGQ